MRNNDNPTSKPDSSANTSGANDLGNAPIDGEWRIIDCWERSSHRDIFTSVCFFEGGAIRFKEEDIGTCFGGPFSDTTNYSVDFMSPEDFAAYFLGDDLPKEKWKLRERLIEALEGALRRTTIAKLLDKVANSLEVSAEKSVATRGDFGALPS